VRPPLHAARSLWGGPASCRTRSRNRRQAFFPGQRRTPRLSHCSRCSSTRRGGNPRKSKPSWSPLSASSGCRSFPRDELCGLALRTVLGPAPPPSRVPKRHPRRVSPVPALDGPCVPRPLRRRVLGGCNPEGFPRSSPLPWPSPSRERLGSLLSRCRGAERRCRLRLMRRTTGLLAFPDEGWVSGLRRLHCGRRRRAATRPLGRYRDRTCTGKPSQASLDTPRERHSAMVR
jgi:hypothetical protein